MNVNKPGKPFFIIAGAIVLLVCLSLVPWGKLTNNQIKDFNLFSDIFKTKSEVTAEEIVDPELLAAMKAGETNGKTVQVEDTTRKIIDMSSGGISHYELATPRPEQNNRDKDSTIIIEDYTLDGEGLKNFKKALSQRNKRPVRVAVIGDSYIEGDIITQNLREILQDKYGGSGVGYMPASSQLTGFRQSINQSCNGWTKHEIRQNMREDMKTIQGEYFTSEGNALSTYKGVSRLKHLDAWDQSTVLAIAPAGGTITLTTDDTTRTLNMAADRKVQALRIDGKTTSAKLSATRGVEVLGVYLNDSHGITVDNMSLRGNSGITHRALATELAQQMRPYADYDLIIVEYGMNALTSKQKDYSTYQKLMIETISRLKDCYPNADILMLGISDRGQKIGGVMQSIPTSQNMTDTQRDMARRTGVLFWDMRAAIGGDGAVMRWRENGFINPDYTHLNHKGGAELAKILGPAIIKAAAKK